MTEILDVMLAPAVACVVLTGIHAYLGLHVIERGVIFVDLALAQVAAFGATTAFLFGFDLHSPQSYFISLSTALVGAGVLAATHSRKLAVPQEALIGIVYAVSASAAILVLSRAPSGNEQLKSLLVGHLLFVGWGEILKVSAVYVFIGSIHYFYRRPFLAASHDRKSAAERGLNVGWWDFLFYASLAVVVTSSVEIAGVLLVFSFLVVPAVCGALSATGIRSRLVVGWATGFFATLLGMAISYAADLPTGATVVCVLGAMAFLFVVRAARGGPVRA